MRALRSFLRCKAMEQRLVVEAMFVVPLVRVALSLLPFRVVHRAVGAAMRRKRVQSTLTAERVVWAVKAVAARVPRATCLTQALAAAVLLPGYGHDATLRVGVAREEDGRLSAHAWLESGGETILGEPAPGVFQAFAPLVLS